MKKLLLASGSPRRRFLLTEAGFIFDTLTTQISETLNKNLNLDEQVKGIARDKARAAWQLLQDQRLGKLILASDTVVILENEVLGKPKDELQAIDFLSRLSGNSHFVKTSICLLDGNDGREACGIETARVTFRPLTSPEITEYVRSGEPMDKAGAYGIQGTGGKFITQLDGRVDNVMGLSIALLENLLAENQWSVLRSEKSS